MATVLIATFTGIIVLLAGNVPWQGFGRISGLGARNLLVGTAVPWAILPSGAGHARRCVAMGCRMLSLGIDVWFVGKGVRAFKEDYAEFFDSV